MILEAIRRKISEVSYWWNFSIMCRGSGMREALKFYNWMDKNPGKASRQAVAWVMDYDRDEDSHLPYYVWFQGKTIILSSHPANGLDGAPPPARFLHGKTDKLWVRSSINICHGRAFYLYNTDNA